MTRQEADGGAQAPGVPCGECGGTGLVCKHRPVIEPGACCVDYANALCPVCGGKGVAPADGRHDEPESPPEAGD